MTPDLSFNAWTTYALPIGLTVGAGIQYTDDVLGRRTADVQITTRIIGCLEGAAWIDGRITAGHQSVKAKHNEQLAENAPLAQQLGQLVLSALESHALFISAALPSKIFPPLFNRYVEGQAFGVHVDNAIRQVRNTPHRQPLTASSI